MADFLQLSTDTLQRELAALPPPERGEVGEFQSVLELAEMHAADEWPNEAMGTALMAVVRLGELLW